MIYISCGHKELRIILHNTEIKKLKAHTIPNCYSCLGAEKV